MVEQEGNGVAQDLTQQTTCQVPQVACPNALYAVALRELRKDGVDSVAKAAQQRAPFGIGVTLLGPVGSCQFDAPSGQLLPECRRVVVAVSDHHAPGMLHKFGHYRKLVGGGRSHRDASDHPRPANPHVYSEAVEGLFEESVLAEGGFSSEATAAVSSSEQTRWEGKRVHKGEGGMVRGQAQKFLPEVLLGLPQVGRLPGEGGAMHPQEIGEQMSVVAPKVGKEFCIFIESQKLANDLDGDDFRVVESRSRSTCSERPEFSDAVVDETEDGDDEGVKIHQRRPPLRRLVWTLPSVGGSSV